MAGDIDVEYPSQHETEVLLRDGSRMLLRPIRRDDTEAWLAFVSGISLGPNTYASILCLS